MLMVITGTYDYRLVALSIVLAMCTTYAALDLGGRVTAAQGWDRVVWLSGGAAAMGLGIWAMHYIGMLAFSLPMPILYHYPTVVLSLLAAIAASAGALFIISRPRMGTEQEIVGSIFMGSGIASMHYIGMAAMRCSAVILYDGKIVSLSIVLAIGISLAALKLAFQVRDEKKLSWRKITSALIMGSAIPLMHYTGMWAATFRPSAMAPDLTHAIGISTIGVAAISGSSFLVLGGAIASSFFDRFLAAQNGNLNTAREHELYFHTMAEAIPEIIWTADPDGADDYFNQKCFDYTGLTFEQSRGAGWTVAVHPDDLDPCLAKWENALRTGNPYEVEYRLRGKDGLFRWFLCRGNPIRSPEGEIVKWFGTCTDIESQKQNQQILEEQILERTVELADSNTRLQEEMSERDLARKALDQQNAKMVRDLTEGSQRATLLVKMGELLQSCISKDEVFSAALGFAPKIFPLTRGAVALLNNARNLVEVIGSWGDCQLPPQGIEPGSCWALRTGHPHLVVAGDSTAACAHAAGVKNTYLCVPILAQGEGLGILHFQATDEAPTLADSELSLKTTFAAQVGLSIANIRLREALRHQSIRDELTGLYNRRYLQEVLEREIRRAVRAAQSMGILMLDLDQFKKINDTYGHEAGDTVLRETASFLTQNIRVEDIVCRFGGEEFVVILPTATLEAATSRAERLRSKLRELTVVHRGQALGAISVSIGVAAVPQHGTSPKELIEAADAALYRAKREGRDRVMVALTANSEALKAEPQAALS